MNHNPEEARPQGRPTAQPNGKDEMNFAEFPIALLTDRVPNGLKTIESHDEFFDERTGKVIIRKRIITGSDKYGLPTAKDDEVILGLIQLTREANGFTERTVSFSRGGLIEQLRWPDSGHSYKRLALSLNRWTGVLMSYEKAWYDNARKSWVDELFHIIERVSLYDIEEQAAQPFEKLSSFTWNEVIFRSFQAGYLRNLNLDFYFSLSSATAKRLYRFLDKRFYLKPNWDFDLQDLAYNHIGLSRGSYEGNGHLAKKLRPAIEELEAKGFLEPQTEQARFERRSRSEWRVLFVRGKGVPSRPPLFEAEASLPTPDAKPQSNRKPKVEPEPTPLEHELITRGVTASTARGLVTEYPGERITAQIDQVDWLREKKPQKISDLAAYLVKAIRNDYAAPEGFVSRAERTRRENAELEQQRQKEEAKKQKDAEDARERAIQDRILEYWNALNPDEQKKLEGEALEQAEGSLDRLFVVETQ